MTAALRAPLELLTALRVLPVVVIDDVTAAASLGSALLDGGLPIAEVTLRTPDALAVLERLAQVPGMTVGVGSVVRPSQVADAASAGARFVVTPGLSRAVVDECRARQIPVVPGVATPTEVIAALDAGLDTVKFFPAQQSGGVATLEAFGGPFPSLRFVPTGGLSPDNFLDYLRLPSVLAVGGSWMVSRSLIAAGDFSRVAALASEAVQAAAGVGR